MKKLIKLIIPALISISVLFTGCSKVNETIEKQQSKFVEQVMASFKDDGFIKTAKNFYGTDENYITNDLSLSPSYIALYDTILSKISYEIANVTLDKDYSTIKVKIRTVNTPSALSEYLKSNSKSENYVNTIDKDVIRQELTKYISSNHVETLDTTIDFHFTKEKNSWVLNWFDNDNFTKLLGGLQEYL